jgi:GTPase SAR1 family protein
MLARVQRILLTGMSGVGKSSVIGRLPLMVERLTYRETNAYGKHPEEIARSLEFKGSVEPWLRTAAHLEIDTSAPLDDVVAAVIRAT